MFLAGKKKLKWVPIPVQYEFASFVKHILSALWILILSCERQNFRYFIKIRSCWEQLKLVSYFLAPERKQILLSTYDAA